MFTAPRTFTTLTHGFIFAARLGKSGLKVSRIILGCMSYGSAEWQGWVLDEKAGLEHIKAAYDAGINAFDTADVRSLPLHILEIADSEFRYTRMGCPRRYSARPSNIMLFLVTRLLFSQRYINPAMLSSLGSDKRSRFSLPLTRTAEHPSRSNK
jgi:hypothetical protein